MFVSIIDLQVGQGNDADTLLSRILSDLVPIYSAAQGFVAYYGIKRSDDLATTIRVFEDQASLEAAHNNAAAATQQIIDDLQLQPSISFQEEAAVVSAFGPVHVP